MAGVEDMREGAILGWSYWMKLRVRAGKVRSGGCIAPRLQGGTILLDDWMREI